VRIGVVGATGRLGRCIVAVLASAGSVVTPIHRHRTHGDSEPQLNSLDALVVCAPLPDVSVHREALANGCHIVDVTVDAQLNEALLASDDLAAAKGRSVIAMAGLAPGLTGALAHAVLDAAGDTAVHAVVTLRQHPKGSAGRQGTRDMLDLLTAPGVRYRARPVYTTAGAFTQVNMFDLQNPEPQVTGLHDRLELATGWCSGPLDNTLCALTAMRRIAPSLYEKVRDLVASHKAAAATRDEQGVTLSAVALDEQGRPLYGREVRLQSDYGATAAITAAAALSAVHGRTPPGAGHLASFLTADQILAEPLLQPQLIGAREPSIQSVSLAAGASTTPSRLPPNHQSQ
jgi:hypothetical protein